MKKVLQISICCLASILIGFFLTTLVYMIPSGRIFEHVKPYKGYIDKLVSPHLIDAYQISKLDTYAESIMLEEAIISAEDSGLPPAKAALTNYYYQNDPSPRHSITKIITGGSLDKVEYNRYWHGYLVTLKPLLFFFTYQQIQWLNLFIQLFLVMFICLQFGKKGLEVYLFPLAVVLFWFQAPYLSLNLQFSTILYIFLLQLCIIMKFDDGSRDNNFYDLFFLFSGIAVAFFDFLTYPLVTLGIPLVVWLILHKQKNVLKTIKIILHFSFYWSLGYAVMWGGKWVLVYLLNSHEILEDVLSQIQTRLGVTNGLTAISPLLVFQTVLLRPTKTLPFIIICGILLYITYIFIKFGLSFSRNKVISCVPYLIIATYPFIWMSIMKNHCLEHNYFVYRILAVSWFAIISSIAEFRKENNQI